jgi:hypothetical protein
LNYSGEGYLIVNAYMAKEAIPVPGVLVRISGADEMTRGISRSEITDEDGVTAAVPLPAPSSDYSLSPGPPEQPYAIYNVALYKPGYYTKHIYNVAVFSGVSTVLPVNMVLKEKDGQAPMGGVDVVSYENPNLE